VPYVEQTTLLEPNNFVPTWEMGGEEKKEISETLRKLRQKFDNIHKIVRGKEQELELARKKLEGMGEQEINLEDTKIEKDNSLVIAQETLERVKHEHDYELMFQRSYKQMLARMKKDLIAIKIDATEQHASYKQKQQIVGQEQDGSRKSKEQRMQAKHKLDALMKEIDLEQRNRQERIQSLQKSIQNKEEALKRRMERVRRQQEIAESAANENKDSNELKMQQNYMVQRLWS